MFVKILEHFGIAISVVLGFLVGLFALAIAPLISGLTGISHWLIAIGLVLLCAGAFYLYGLIERLFDTGLDKLSRGIFSTGVKASTASDANDRWFRYAGRIAFFAGVVAAFVLGSIMDPAEIMEFF